MPDFEQVCHRLFSDSHWLSKCIAGAILTAVPVLNFFAFGYLGWIVKATVDGEPFQLPEWTDWRELFMNGIVFFAIFIAYAGGLFVIGWLISLPLRLWAGLFAFLPWAGLLAYVPFIPALALASPLTAAGWYRYAVSNEPIEAFRLPELFRLLREGGARLVLPTLAFVGFIAIGLPLFPLAFFVGGIVVFYFYSYIFCHVESRRPVERSDSFSVL